MLGEELCVLQGLIFEEELCGNTKYTSATREYLYTAQGQCCIISEQPTVI
jgi:hypothetical protein